MESVCQNQRVAKLDSGNIHGIFHAFPLPALILLPDPPTFTIVEMNDAYRRITDSRKGDWINSGLFEKLRLNRSTRRNMGAIRSSLNEVLIQKCPDRIKLPQISPKDRQKKGAATLQFEHTPVMNPGGGIAYIIHSVDGVTGRRGMTLAAGRSEMTAGTDKITDDADKERLIREITKNSRDLQQFSYITSHNLRSPITNLMSLISLVENMTIENDDLKELLDDIHTSTRNLNSTLDDLIRILFIRDNPSVEKERILFSEVLEKVLIQNRELVESQNARIITDFEDAPHVTFNYMYLESIILNLLTNALKFSAPSRACEISITTRLDDGYVLLTFKDNGIGMDAEKHRHRLCGMYQKFHSHTAGKGLGLHLVKSQLEALDGNISIKSKVGEGMIHELRFKDVGCHSVAGDHPIDCNHDFKGVL